ncbi:integral membrane protein GPR155 isoform X2 [Macrosteles quadrilineatus]|uniref:integral membrane protein GPR155 isoform X2 n=1 Tax=Macrosteles quadrilineatus TaxID=74068 RepID=UPI0023E223D2|nr:integral membrane protein GPR155 isoform X2 [Macrosteles quadrilineatus]
MESSLLTTLDKLYPALTQCFAVIISGYFAGRIGVVTEEQSSGLNTFVGTFSLPSLIFLSLASIELSDVNWYFLVAILVSKALVFLSVVLVTLLVSRPFSPARAGLYAIFCTQSNDFAIGFPIVVALYKTLHPDYVSYLYLLAPVSLVILNPFGFVLMEVSRHRAGEGAPSTWTTVTNIARNIATNPIVFMTTLGMIANILFKHALPKVLEDVLNVFGSAFTGTALFLLGLRMVGKVQKLHGFALLVPGILIAVKLLALPLVTREVVSLVLQFSQHNKTEVEDLSTYGFLYGTFPSAPGVFVYATRYALDVDLIACAMVACTFLSAPLMFASAKMVIASNLDPDQFMKTLSLFEFDISVVASLAAIWMLVVFIVNKSYQNIHLRMVMYLVISQLVGCLGFLIGHIPLASAHYTHVAMETVGDLSARLWTALLACALLLVQCRNICSLVRLQPVFLAIAWGIPMLAVSVMMVMARPQPDSTAEGYEFGRTQAAIVLFVLITSFIVTVGCLVLHQFYLRRQKQYLLLVREANDTIAQHHEQQQHSPATNGGVATNKMEDRVSINSVRGSVGPERQSSEERQLATQEDSLLRLIVLLVFLACSVFISLSVCVWRVVMEGITGVYVEMLFLDTSLNRGQSLLVLAVYGLDSSAIFEPIISGVSRLWYGGEALQLPPWEDLTFETRHVCEQFISHHLDQCRQQVCTETRWRLWRYKQVFSGESLADWLLQHSVATDRPQAVEYCNHLVWGRVISHLHGVEPYHDKPDCWYTFAADN